MKRPDERTPYVIPGAARCVILSEATRLRRSEASASPRREDLPRGNSADGDPSGCALRMTKGDGSG